MGITDDGNYPVLVNLISEVRNVANDENDRVSSETKRINAEAIRVDGEKYRVNDYSGLKRIILDENQAANLQNQVNTTNSQLADIAKISDVLNLTSDLNDNMIVKLPKGNYALDVTVPENTVLYGDGSETWIKGVLKLSNNSKIKQMKIGDLNKQLTMVNGAKNIEIEDCVITGGNELGALYLDDMTVENIIFKVCYFTGAVSNGVKFVDKGRPERNIEKIYFDDCDFYNNAEMNFEIILRRDGVNLITDGYRKLKFNNCRFIKEIDSQKINVSFDSHTLSDNSGQAGGFSEMIDCTIENGLYALEIAGAIQMKFDNLKLKKYSSITTEKAISMSRLDNIESNSTFINSDIDCNCQVEINGNGNTIKNNKIKCKELIILKGTSNYIKYNEIVGLIQFSNSFGNYLENNIIDSALQNPISFYYALSKDNHIKFNTFKKEAPPFFTYELGATSQNFIQDNYNAKGCKIISQSRLQRKSDKSGAGTVILKVTNKNKTRQEEMMVKVTWSGRGGQSPIGGIFIINFGTYDVINTDGFLNQIGTTIIQTKTTIVDVIEHTFSVANASDIFFAEIEVIGSQSAIDNYNIV